MNRDGWKEGICSWLAFSFSSMDIWVVPECTKIARFSAVAAAIFTAPPQNRVIFKAPTCAISSAKKIASERRFSLRLKGTNLIPLRNSLRYLSLRRKSLANGDARFWCTQGGTIRTAWITPHHLIFRELISVIITPPITP